MGVRNTSKLLPTTLLTLSLLLLSVFAGPAAARSIHAHHHGLRGAGKRGTHRHQHLRISRHARGIAPKRVIKVREKAVRNAGSKSLDAAAQTAATIASVLATPCQNTEITPEPSNFPQVREAVLCLVNRERAEHSLSPLKRNAELEAAAENHNAEMIELDYFEHVAPDGETPVERIKKTGYIESASDGYVIGENLAWGTYQLSTPKAIVEAWIASPGHLANILESRYTETGIGVVAAVPQSLGEGNPGATYAQEFGLIVE